MIKIKDGKYNKERGLANTFCKEPDLHSSSKPLKIRAFESWAESEAKKKKKNPNQISH